MKAVLEAFHARVERAERDYSVVIDLGGDAEIVGVLNALQKYVSQRGAEAARVDFNGHSYTMHP